MDKTLKRYINDLILTLAVSQSNDKDDYKIDFVKLRLRMLQAIKNYSSLRIKILQNKSIVDIEHQVIKTTARIALDSACKSYNISIPSDIRDKLIDEYFEALLDFIHNTRCNIFMDCLSYSEAGIKLYESK